MPKKQNPLSPLSRRRFVAMAGMIPAAVAASSLSSRALAATPSASDNSASSPKKKYPIGLELYSVRGELQKDLPNTLRQVAKIGYEVVEFFAPYFAWTPPYAKEVRTQLDDLGLRCYSTHNHIASFTAGETMSRAIELNQILGARTLVLASAPNTAKGVEGWKTLCGQLTTAVEEFKKHGLSVGFHNHQTEWAKLDGEKRVMDILAENTPQEFVLQFDVGTCVNAGADPIAWITGHPGRIKSVHLKDWAPHLKDWAPGKPNDEKAYRVLFGEGVTPWKEICAAAESVGGVEYYLMEQEGSRFPEFETAQRCLDAWKTMRRGA